MSAPMPPEMVELLTAIVDALDIPLPGLDERDERAFCRLMENRRSAVYSTLASLLADPDPRIHDHDTRYIRRRTTDTPITYTVWRDPEPATNGGEQG